MDSNAFADINEYRRDIETAYTDVTEAFTRWRQKMEWALEDVKKVSDDPDKQLKAQLQLIQTALMSEMEYHRGMMDSIITLGARMTLDMKEAGVLSNLPPGMEDSLRKHLERHEAASIEGIGSWNDLIANMKEPDLPKKERKGIRDADGNYES